MSQPSQGAGAFPDPEDVARNKRQFAWTFVGLMLAMLLAALDQTIVATALPTIVGELNGLEHLSWVVTAYLLASTIGLPIYGKIGDLFGRKPIFLFAIAVFLVGSALSGAAQSMGELIAFRALQGIGGGGLMIGAQAIVGDIIPPRQRGRYAGLMGSVFGLASIAGPLIGGYLTDNVGWRWVFYINLPLGLAAFATVLVTLHLHKPTGARPRLDYAGTGLLGAVLLGRRAAHELGRHDLRLGEPADPRPRRGDRRDGRGLRAGGAPRRAPDHPAVAVPRAQLRLPGRGRRDHRHRHVRDGCLPADVPADGRAGERDDVGPDDDPDGHRHADHLHRHRAADHPHGAVPGLSRGRRGRRGPSAWRCCPGSGSAPRTGCWRWPCWCSASASAARCRTSR